MSYEEEIKLTAPSAAVLDAVAADPLVAAAARGQPPVQRPFLATYYDTPDRLLLRSALALRMRREQNDWRAELKGNGSMVNGIARRMEWHTRVNKVVTHFGDLPPGPIRDQMLTISGPTTALQPLLTTDFQRLSRIIYLDEEGSAELALDRGVVLAGGKRQVLYEVEVEKIDGPLSLVLQFAHTLARRHPLKPSIHSKFSLGLTLLGMKGPRP